MGEDSAKEMSMNLSDPFERLCGAHIPMLKRYLFQKIANPADAQDILQDVLVSAYTGFGALRNKELFKSWIIGIASHKCLDYSRPTPKRSKDSVREAIPTRKARTA